MRATFIRKSTHKSPSRTPLRLYQPAKNISQNHLTFLSRTISFPPHNPKSSQIQTTPPKTSHSQGCCKISRQPFPVSGVRLFAYTLSDMNEHCQKTHRPKKPKKAMSVQSRQRVREPSEHRIWKWLTAYFAAALPH